jgi:type VI secretion system protein ImpL
LAAVDGRLRDAVAGAFGAVAGKLRRLRRGAEALYAAPWIMVLGESGSGKSALVTGARLEPLFPEDGPEAVRGVCALHVLAEGVVIDLDGDQMGSSLASRPGWDAVLQQLQFRRQLRPLDGVVLTISCEELIGGDRAADSALFARGDTLRERMADLLRATGLRLPVYIVLTHADRIPGFRSFWAPARTGRPERQIVGWTNADSSGVDYGAALPREALDTLSETLWKDFVETTTDQGVFPEADDAFAFLERLRGLAAPLHCVLDRAFRANAFEDRHLIRGIYVTGCLGEGEAPAFALDLFRYRVFAEAGVARAARSAIIGRTRTIRTMQAAAVLLLPLMGTALLLSARSTAALAEQVSAALLVERGPAAHTDEGVAQQLVDRLSAIDRDSFANVLLPTSWLGTLEDRVIQRLQARIEAILIEPAASRVKRGYEEIAVSEPVAADPKEYRLAGARDIIAAQKAANQIANLDRAVVDYSRLPDLTLPEFARFISFVYDLRIGPRFALDGGLYGRAMDRMHGRSMDVRSLRNAALSKYRRQQDIVITRVGSDGGVAQLFLGVRDSVRELTDAALVKADAQLGERLADAVAAADLAIESGQIQWLALESLRGEPAVLSWLTALDAVDGDEGKKAGEALDGAVRRLRISITGLVGPHGERVFRIDRESRAVRFSEIYEALARGLRPIMARPFMHVMEPPGEFPNPPGRGHLLWDRDALDRAKASYADYERARAQDLKEIRGDFSRIIDRLVRQRAEAALSANVLAAQTWVPARLGAGADMDATLLAEARSLQDASPALLDLLASARQETFATLGTSLSALLRRRGEALLLGADELARSENLYLPLDQFRTWTGEGSPIAAGYQSPDELSLATLLDAQRARVEVLSDQIAQPAIELLGREDLMDRQVRGPAFERWRQVGYQLRLYRSKNPASTLAVLEHVLRSELPAVTLDACQQKIVLSARRGTDLFSDRADMVRRQLLERCRDLLSAGASSDYADLATRFNTLLAGRFPFADPGREGADADPAAVVEVMRAFEQVEPRLRPALAARMPGDREAEAAMHFVDRLARVRAFLGPALGAGEGGAPGYEVTAAFRTNRAREAGGNQILDWRLEVGAETLRRDAQQTDGGQPPPATAPVAGWRPGVPVSVALRWAKDGPTRPLSAPAGPDVDGLTARFSYTGAWSLLRMIARQRPLPGEFERGVDIEPTTLGFRVAVGSQSDVRADASPPVRVFIRLALTGPGAEPGARQRFFPPEFPTSAPRLLPPKKGVATR